MSQAIESIDKNLAVNNTIGETDVVFYDVRKDPFEVYGLYNYRSEPVFCRMPTDIASATSEGVSKLCYQTAGGRIRFSTDSDYIAIHADMHRVSHFSHMPMTGSAGFDLFIDEPESGISRFHRPFIPAHNMTDGYESKINLKSKKLRHFTIYFPTYSGVKNLYIGIRDGSSLGGGMPYREALPIVYYGSSITQGGCSSRPGNAYQSVVSRRLGLDFVNLGFSGSGKAEDVMLDYLKTIPMSAFVSDYDHNAPDVEHLKNTHLKLYQAIRSTQPDIPYIMLSCVDFDCFYDQNILRRDVVYNTYLYAREHGDRNVYFIDGAGVFRGPYEDMCTVDGCHPNDLGFALMADAVEATLKRAFTQHLFP